MLKLLTLLICLSNCVRINESKPNPLLLVSFDGFRSSKLEEFLDKNPNSNFAKFISRGVKAEYMVPSFPSLTFPNHWALVTGRYVESHGIIGNHVYYPEAKKIVSLGVSRDTKYWNETDPIWLTAKNQGKKTASSYWVGSEANNRQPDIYLSYGEKLEFKDRIDMLVNWFIKFDMDFVCLYFDQPDSVGHSDGPNSPAYAQKVEEMDGIFGYLIKRLTEANLIDNLNMVVVSDHGMAELMEDFQVPLAEHLNLNETIDLNKTVFGAVSNIYPLSNNLIDVIIYNLSRVNNLQVFRKEDVPAEFHYSKNALIAPIVAVASEGYEVADQKIPPSWSKKGAHGYNNSIAAMRAIFLAAGPNFKSNKILKPFQNVNVYSLLCKLIEIKCNPSNGTAEIFSDVLISNANKQSVFQDWSFKLSICFFSVYLNYY